MKNSENNLQITDKDLFLAAEVQEPNATESRNFAKQQNVEGAAILASGAAAAAGSENQMAAALAAAVSSSSPNETPYRVLALRYRPSSFEDLIGQDIAVKFLTNALESQRFPHAILLTGIQGTGKTTTARLICKALNCKAVARPTANFCGRCEQCLAIEAGNNQDVLEIDAASHTGVQDIREIIENSRYLPNYGRFRIYIIDEAHMLSRNAFDALLKTLEEPAGHVKFILATTEQRKIPPTILSRCQRLALRRLSVTELADYYAQVIRHEGGEISQEALADLAVAANGSVRDGLSMLEQALALSGDERHISAALTQEMLGKCDILGLCTLLRSITEGDIKGSLRQLQEIQMQTSDSNLIIDDLLYLLNWLTKKITLDYAAIDDDLLKNDNSKDTNDFLLDYRFLSLKSPIIADLLRKIDVEFLLYAWHLATDTAREMSVSTMPALDLEMLVLKLLHIGGPLKAEIIEITETNDRSDSADSYKNEVNRSFSKAEMMASGVTTHCSVDLKPGVQPAEFSAVIPKNVANEELNSSYFNVRAENKQNFSDFQGNEELKESEHKIIATNSPVPTPPAAQREAVEAGKMAADTAHDATTASVSSDGTICHDVQVIAQALEKSNHNNIAEKLEDNLAELYDFMTKINYILDQFANAGELTLYHKLAHNCAIMDLDISRCYMKIVVESDNKFKELHTIANKLQDITNNDWKVDIVEQSTKTNLSYYEICEKIDEIRVNQILQEPLIYDIINLVDGVKVDKVRISELLTRPN